MGVNELHRIMAGRDEHDEWPPETIEKIRKLAKDVSLLKEKDDRSGWTPLHYGLKYKASGNAIQAIVEAFPKAAEMVDNNGHTPVDLGIQEGSPAEALKAVLTACPSVAKTVDGSGRTLLHLAIHYGRVSADAIKAVLAARPQASKVKDSDLRTPLHLCMKKGAPTDAVKAVLESFPKAAEMVDGNGQMPLHSGIQNGASAGAIHAVLDVFPEAASVEFRDGKTPLYRAIENLISADAIEALVDVYPEAASFKNNFGRTPLFLCLEKRISTKALRAVLEAFPQAAEFRDTNGYTPLHWGMGYGASADTLLVIMEAFPEAAGMQDKDGMTPLFVGMEKGVSSSSILAVLEAYPPAVEMQDNMGSTPLRYGIVKGAPVDVIKCMLEAWPYSAVVRDANGFTPLMIHVRLIYDEEARDETTTREQIDVDTNMMQMLAERYPEAGEVEDLAGMSPISFLINICLSANDFASLVCDDTCFRLQILMKGIRDGRPLKKLCTTQNPVALQVFFSLFDESGGLEEGRTDVIPEIDLNKEKIPGWTMLEVLADVDNMEASNVIFQLVEDQKRKLVKGTKDNVMAVNCLDKSKTIVSFCSISIVSEKTMKKVADRAKLSNSSERLKVWGEEYGRFMGKYRIEDNGRPKHRSANCVVLFATELVPSHDDGRKIEERVALKFMADDDAFAREIKNRQTIVTSSGEDGSGYVAGIRAGYTTGTTHESELRSIPHVFFRKELSKDIAKYGHVLYLNPTMGVEKSPEISHLLVLDCGSGEDLSDATSHQDISGKNLFHILHAGISISRCLQFLNDDCSMVHGDVNPRNFVSLKDGTNYLAIDLDHSCFIDGEISTIVQSCSGYLPPEQARVEYYERSKHKTMGDVDVNGGAPSRVDENLKDLEEVLANAPEDYRPYIQNEINRIQKEQIKLQFLEDPETVVASSQYDMWCFGVLLYQLCTCRPLFRVDRNDNVLDIEELKRIAQWSEEDVEENLELMPKGEGWQRIKLLLEDLLQPDPLLRPESWVSIISSLEKGSLSESQTLRNLESITPDVLTQLETATCPFLLHFINDDDFRKFKSELSAPDDSDYRAQLEIKLDRARNLLQWASEIVKDPTGIPAKPSKNMLKNALKKVTGNKEESVYLQLLCGWSLQPVVSYRVPLDKYLEKAQKVAQLGAKTCATGIKVSMLWNSASSSARMFGCPMPLVPIDIVESAKEFLEGVCSSPPVLELVSNKSEGLRPKDMTTLAAFLRELEENWRLCHILDETGDLEGSWEDALKCEAVFLEGRKPQVTYISVKESVCQAGC